MGSYGYSPIDLKRKDLASWSRPSLPRAFPIMQQHIALSASQPDLVKYSFPISRVLFKSSSSFVSEYIFIRYTSVRGSAFPFFLSSSNSNSNNSLFLAVLVICFSIGMFLSTPKRSQTMGNSSEYLTSVYVKSRFSTGTGVSCNLFLQIVEPGLSSLSRTCVNSTFSIVSTDGSPLNKHPYQ